MKKFFRDILTGCDNQTYDIGRVGILLGLLSLVGLEVQQIIITKIISFNPINFATAVGIILGAGGAALKMKENTEPKPPENKP